jgi:hypothetical protein
MGDDLDRRQDKVRQAAERGKLPDDEDPDE